MQLSYARMRCERRESTILIVVASGFRAVKAFNVQGLVHSD